MSGSLTSFIANDPKIKPISFRECFNIPSGFTCSICKVLELEMLKVGSKPRLSPSATSFYRKRTWGGLRQFKLRGTGKVTAVFGLHEIAYNLIRLGGLLRPAMAAV